MKEVDFLNIINNTLDFNSLLGDDCAYLDDLDIFITQDTLVEDVHFSLHTTSPYLLGRKALSVNLSDLAVSLAKPCYVSVSVSLPKHINDNFVEELYRGINSVCNEYEIKVSGGDITGSDKVVISVCAIGKKISPFITSRSFAKRNDYVLVTGEIGKSSIGLYALDNFLYIDDEIRLKHLNPTPRIFESSILRDLTDTNIAVMDTSDGLVDALYKISQSSKHCIQIDINKVPVSQKVINFAKNNKLDYKKYVKWGGEDFELVVCVPEHIYEKLDKSLFTCIGRVQNKDVNPNVVIKDGVYSEKITKDIFELNSYNHF